MNHTDLINTQLSEELYVILSQRPLDDVIDALADCFRRRSGYALSENFDAYMNTALELEALKARDFTPSEDASIQ